jgi:hypothetical protein
MTLPIYDKFTSTKIQKMYYKKLPFKNIKIILLRAKQGRGGEGGRTAGTAPQLIPIPDIKE